MSDNWTENMDMISVPNVIRSFGYWPRVFQLLWRASPGYLLAITSLNLIQGFLPALSIGATQQLINSITSNWDEMIGSFLFFISVMLCTLLSSSLQSYVETLFQGKLSNSINIMVMEKAASLTMSDFENAKVQDQLKRVQNDSGHLPFQITKQIFGIVSNLVSLVAISTILVLWKWWVALLLFLVPLVSFVFFLRFGQRQFVVNWKRADRSRTAWYLSYLLTRDSSFKEVKLYNFASHLIAKYRGIVEGFLREDKRLARKQASLTFTFQFIDLGMFTLTLFLAFWSAFHRQIQLGNVVGIIQAITQIQSKSQSIIQQVLGLCQSNLYMEQLFAFLDIRADRMERRDDPALVRDKHNDRRHLRIERIEFKNVSFSYPEQNQTSLRKIGFTLERGESMAIVGHNGSGKSTLIKLLMQLYTACEGQILVNGLPVQAYDLSAYQERIGAVFQDFVQYEMPLRHNVGYGNIEEIDNERKLWQASSAAGIDAFIEKLPKRFDTQLGRWFEEGYQLSGGQWQRVAIARAFMRDADVYILDEPSSFLDPQAEREVFEKFRELVKGRIGIFISHRLSSVTFADKIMVLHQGEVVEIGTHHELMNNNGTYAKLYRIQADTYIRQAAGQQDYTNIV
ncbi:ABC transporter ATP-binding protein [Paenibacillus ehimensis]|uniref:ABC transporter ATP-binding protein n=1 Tax=Paenibacillus ehimensis TaxID=79264 RepID=A0ABT8V620_9BACL|nr:ABC transporter ATP-binding protein [Paenibacillus ehimensis]MDO3676876.1 ABC transporter ATP-binding protein [Paenibacillus ehimensis]MEC0210464.1 ABC transporter ATP-binding protein [Paenibacillus ehimensis]